MFWFDFLFWCGYHHDALRNWIAFLWIFAKHVMSTFCFVWSLYLRRSSLSSFLTYLHPYKATPRRLPPSCDSIHTFSYSPVFFASSNLRFISQRLYRFTATEIIPTAFIFLLAFNSVLRSTSIFQYISFPVYLSSSFVQHPLLPPIFFYSLCSFFSKCQFIRFI